MAVRLFSLSVEDYLFSENFSRFCKEYDLDDVWKESLDLSRDRPDLYGGAVMKNAFVEFLHHMFHSRLDEFPALFTRFLAGFLQVISKPLPFDELKKDLMELGYPAEDLEKKFSVFRAIEEEHRKRGTTDCPG
jgi:hypothetical protein